MKRIMAILVIILCLFLIFASTLNVFALPYGNGDIIELGIYPQTIITDHILIDELEKEQHYWCSYDYYFGKSSHSGIEYMDGSMIPTDYMIYCDVEYPKNSGEFYRGVCFNQYRPYQTSLISSSELTHQKSNGFLTGTIYWFKWEPLEWIILDSSNGLLLCKNVVDAQPFNNVVYFNHEIDSFCYCDKQKSIIASDYSKSSIRAWLSDKWSRNSFYNIAFQNHTIIQDAVLSGEQYNYDVSDKVFLLSDKDIESESYKYLFYDKSIRCARGTDYAKCQGLFVGNGDYLFGEPSCWLIRSDDLDNGICVVEQDDIFTNAYPNTPSFGIRPSIKIDLNKFKNRVIDVVVSDVTIRYKEKQKIIPKIVSDVDDPQCGIVFSYEDNDAIWIEQDGSIISRKEGQTIVTVVVTDQCENKISKTFNVTVYYTWWQKLIRWCLLGFLWY